MRSRTPLRNRWWVLIVVILLVGCNVPDTPQPTDTEQTAVQVEIPPVAPTETQPLPTPTVDEPVVAIVNGEEIGQRAYEAHLARYQDAQAQAGTLLATENMETTVLDDLIARLLLVQGARAGGTLRRPMGCVCACVSGAVRARSP